MSEIIENSLEELLLLFNYSADLPRCGIADAIPQQDKSTNE